MDGAGAFMTIESPPLVKIPFILVFQVCTVLSNANRIGSGLLNTHPDSSNPFKALFLLLIREMFADSGKVHPALN